MRHTVARATRGTSPSIQKINQRTILEFPYPSPVSLAQQQAILEYLTAVEARAVLLQESQRQIATRAASALSTVVTDSLESLVVPREISKALRRNP